jgi:nuclear pore complex protein Nup107
MAGTGDGSAFRGASSSGSTASRRSENLQRLINDADQSVNLLASLGSWADNDSARESLQAQPASAFSQSSSGLEGFRFTNSSVADTDAADDSQVVDLSIQRGLLHVKGVFADHSVEFADIDPRFTTIRDLKRALCDKRNARKDLGFSAHEARVMFNGQLVEDDWLVVDCGLGVDGAIYIVKALSTGAYFGGGGASFSAKHADARLPVSSIASSYAQQQQQQQLAKFARDNDDDSMLMEFSHSLAFEATQRGGQMSYKVRPEEASFAEMLSDFYEHLDGVQDTDAYGERLLRGYIDVLQSRLETLEASVDGSTRSAHAQRQRLQDSIRELRDERNTWRLLFELRRICHGKNSEDDYMDMGGEAESLGFDMVEDDAVGLLERQNDNYKIQKAVKTWLENIAMEKAVHVSEKRDVAKHGSRTLKMVKKGFTSSAGGIRMDPDAVLRKGDQHIVEDDAEDECELLRGVWSFLRAGNLQEAVDLCVRLGEPWRAASLSGGIQVGASEVDEAGGQMLERWGNPVRALWKTTSWKFAEAKDLKLSKRNSRLSRQYEEIVYAALSGHLQVLTRSSLCESWDDHCWAYLHAMTERQVDETLYKLLQVKLQSSQLIVGNDQHYLRLYRAHLDKTKHLKRFEANLDALFEELRTSKSEIVRKQAHDPYRQIQAKLVTAKVDSIVNSIAQSLVSEDPSEGQRFDWNLRLDEHVPADDVSPLFLRFAAHFVVFSSFTEESMDELACQVILKAYLRHLVKHGHFKLVPVYASRLPVDGAVEVYVQVLLSLDDRLQRELFVRRVHDYATMDVLNSVVLITAERQSAALVQQARCTASSSDAKATTPVDRMRMRVIEYLCFYNEHRAEALRRSNLLAREFIFEEKFNAVKELFVEHVSEESLGLVKLHRAVQTVRDDAEVERILRAHLCWKAYIRACNHYDLWRSCTAGRMRVSWAAYSEEKEFLTELMYHVSRSTTAIVDVLHFEHAWMAQCSDDTGEDASIRQVCLPLLALHLHFIQLESAKLVLRLQFYPTDAKLQLARPLLEKSLQVADVVADEQYGVAEILTTDHCRELLNGFHESSIALLHLESMVAVEELDDEDHQRLTL